MKDLYLGIDPGKKGCAAVVNRDGKIVTFIRFSKATWHDVNLWLKDVRELVEFAFLERVNAMPPRPRFEGDPVRRAGTASSFAFGYGAGLVEGLLIAHDISYQKVTPSKWQSDMGCQTHGDKHITKVMAQQLWPADHAWTLEEPDGCLIAEYCRRMKKS
jgi:hypothetical protein